MTEGKPLDAARIALVRDRLGALLTEQPGAFDTYDMPLQTVTPAMWWDEDLKVIASPVVVGWLARFWPDQPLSATLGAYYEISVIACGIAQRADERPRWEGVSPESKAHLKALARRTGRSEESLRRMGKNFDDRKHREAVQLVQIAAAKLRAAFMLLCESAAGRFAAAREIFAAHVIDKQAIRRPPSEARRLTERVELFAESLSEKTFGGLAVPQSEGQWKTWETMVGGRLIQLGVSKAQVVALFKRPKADPEDERARIRRNLRRLSKRKVASKGAPTNKRTAIPEDKRPRTSNDRRRGSKRKVASKRLPANKQTAKASSKRKQPST